ncbi:hypothetical protein AGMMS50256_38750 [Betaproteobacteria bacterium]|nr:hypothetical protein AGMMS50256_38750 [Betaproteobacteria bacterium]
MTTTTATRKASPKAHTKTCVTLEEHIVEIISDSGEGAQRCGQSLGSIAARMGNGIWTTEIIPAEIRPPARSVAGASGNRIRIGSSYVTNGGDETDLVVAFNEQVLLGRVNARELKPGCIILLENMWRTHSDPNIVKSYTEAYDRLVKADFKVYEIPMEEECLRFTTNARRGKNMFALGILCHIYNFDLQAGREQIALIFGKKEQSVIAVTAEDGRQHVALLDLGRLAGARAAALDVDHDERNFGHDRQTDAFLLERKTGAGGDGHRAFAGVGRTDGKSAGSDFVLGLMHDAADFLENFRQIM